MTERRTVEIFSAGCAICRETVSLVESMACESCAVNVLDIQDRGVAERARQLGRNFLVLNGHEPRQHLDDVHLAPEGAIDRGKLNADGAGADDRVQTHGFVLRG